MSKTHKKLECSANEYFWLKNELYKALQNFNHSIFMPTQNPAAQKEHTQAYAILISFYKKALGAFTVRPNTAVSRPIVISHQFLEDLKSLDTTGLIDLSMVRKGTPESVN